VFREAARQAQWLAASDPSGFQVSVNKSPVQFRRDAALYQGWLDYLRELGLPAQSIVIEITEGVLMDGAQQVIERLRSTARWGCRWRWTISAPAIRRCRT
jgi:EAL domain-containing protein (putative c-di-GMP-specific phosphodiesterase class I)